MDIQAATGTTYVQRDTARPTISGKAESEKDKIGSVAQFWVGGQFYSVPIDPATGSYTWTAPADIPDGNYSVSITVKDRAGNVGQPLLFTLQIDTTPPEPPELLVLFDDQGPITGSFDAGKTTDDRRPTLTGLAQKGTTVYLKDESGNIIGSAKADSVSGKWVMEPTQDLKDGVNNLTLTAEETFAGKVRTGAESAPFTIVIADDVPVLPPNTITITEAIDDAGAFTGKLASGALTDDTTPTLRGDVSAGSSVTVYYRLVGSDTWAGSAVATVSGQAWTWTPGSALPTGEYEFQASTGSYSSTLFKLDIASPAEITLRTRIEAVIDDEGPVTGPLQSGAMTDDASPTFQGRAEANSQVIIRYTPSGGDAASVTVSADDTGRWSWTHPTDLAVGQWAFDVKAKDQTTWSESFTLIIHPDADRDAKIDSAYDNAGPKTGILASGANTDDNTPTLNGSGPASSVIALRYKLGNGQYTLINVNVDASGNWTWTAPTLAKGSWTFEVQKAGQSDWSSFTLTIDPNLDRNATIDSALDNAGPVTGSLSSGESTDDTTPTLHGSGPASSTITLRYKLGSGSYASTTVSVDGNGKWTWTPDTLTKGSWTFEVQKAGQNDWSSFTLTIDPDLDRYPTIDSALDNEGPVTDTLRSGDTTDDSTPTLRGSGVANSVITLRYKLDSGSYASTTVNVDGSGKWTWTPDTLASGSWTFEVQKAGQSGWSSFTLTIDPTVDHDAVITSAWDDFGAVTGTIANGGITDDSTPTLRGTGPANSTLTLKYSNGDGSVGVTIKVDSSGNWTWTAPELEEGHWTFEVKKTGQESASRYELTIDANADRNASIDSAFDNVGPVTGSLSSGATTDDTTPTLRGTGPANSVITLRYKLGNGGYTLDSASVDADGNWSWTPKTLAKGNWTFEVQKASQNDWSSFTLTIDPTVDRNATIDYAYDNFGDVKGMIARGGITDDATPTLSGTGPANSLISLRYKLGSGTYTTTSVSVDANGNWSWTPDALAKGSWTFEVQRAGQSDWKSFQLTIEPTADRKPIIESAWDDFGPTTGLIANGGTTDDSTPTLRGTGAANSTILLRYFCLATMYEDTIKVDASGNWTWTAPELIDGLWTFEVKKQGDYKWNSYELTVDSNADRDATIDSALDNAGPVTGSLASGATTDDTTPTLRGSGPANSVITLRYKLGNDSYASTTVNVDGSGKWTWTSSALAKGSWTFEVQKAGQSDWSRFQLTIDPTLDMQPTIDDALDNFGAVTGSLKNGDTTDDSTPTLRGRGVAGTIIHIERCLSGMQWASVGSTVVKADGTWDWTSPALSSSNTWNFQARAQTGDHYSAWSDKFVVEYVAAAPGAPVITDAFDNFGAETGSLASGDTTDDQTPTLRGTALANSVVMIRAQHAAGEKIYSVQASADGNWSWTPEKALAKGDWDFQVKKSGAESWGQTFELNLDRGPIKSSIIDFERFNAGDVEPDYQYWFEDNFDFKLYNIVGQHEFTRVVDTPDNAPDILGDKAFIIGDATQAYLGYYTTNELYLPFDNFKCDIWNGGGQDVYLKFYYQSYKHSGNPREFSVTIKAGEVWSLNVQDYIADKSLQPELYLIHFDFGYNKRNLYIDNLTIEYSPKAFIPLADEVENIVHFLDGVDALTEHAIIGSEKQVDTLQLTGKDQLLDLSQHKAEIQSVEIFDIRGSGDNTLIIDLDALLHYGEKDLFIEDGKTQLMVNGDAGDVVQLKDILPQGSDISEWQHQQGTVTVAGVEYEVYSHGDDAELLVQQGVKTELI